MRPHVKIISIERHDNVRSLKKNSLSLTYDPHVRTTIAEQTASAANDPRSWPQFLVFAAPLSAPETQKG